MKFPEEWIQVGARICLCQVVNLQKSPSMTRYVVQFVLPVDNPTMNVSIRRAKEYIEFNVPINYPDAHDVTFSELLDAAGRSGLVHLSTPLNKNRLTVEGNRSNTRQ